MAVPPSPEAAAAAVEAIHTVAQQLDPFEEDAATFNGRLSRTLAELAGAESAAVFEIRGNRRQLLKPAFGADLAAEAAEPPGSLTIPWRAGEDEIGVVTVGSPGPEAFSAAQRAALEAGAATAAWVFRRRQRLMARLAEQQRETARARSEAERAAELEDMKRRILNLAAHELRGPITVIRGYLDMLGDGSLEGSALRRVLPILSWKAAQMTALVSQMLEVARLDEGRLELSRRQVDLGEVCREVTDVAGLIAPPGISIFLERPPRPVEVYADRERLATVVANLIDNAIKYSPAGGTVHCRVGRERGWAYLEVRDEGLGIAAADMPLLFTRFGRIVTPENSHISGTGLGLHLSQELARMHGGEIVVSSEEGRGSVFTLQLPG